MAYGTGRARRPNRPRALVARIKAENRASVAGHKADKALNKSRSNGETPKRIAEHTSKQTTSKGDQRVKVEGYSKGDGTRVRTHYRRDSGIGNPNTKKVSAADEVYAKYYKGRY